MISFPLPPKIIQKKKNHAVFEIEALYPGYGVTIGNALRRVLLTSMEGVSVTQVKIKGVAHEFSTISGVLEDVIMIILNLKNLRFKMHDGETQKVQLKVKGEREVKGSDFEKNTQVELINPDVYICTITDKKTELEMEILLEKGIGYEPKDQRRNKKTGEKNEIGTIAMDAIFTPIKNVNFQVESMRVGDRTDFDKLSLEVETDGTITPEMAYFEACEILIKHFNIIFEGNAFGKKEKIENEEPVDEAEKSQDAGQIAVEELKLTGRTLSALVKNNIKTVAGIMKKSEKSLAELDGMGDKAMSEIKRRLKKLGLELKSE